MQTDRGLSPKTTSQLQEKKGTSCNISAICKTEIEKINQTTLQKATRGQKRNNAYFPGAPLLLSS